MIKIFLTEKLIICAIWVMLVISTIKLLIEEKNIKKTRRLINFVVTIYNRVYKFHNKIGIDRIKYNIYY